MSILKIQAALEKRLALMQPDLPTAYENEAFEPISGSPYQRVELMPNSPVDRAITMDVLEFRGLFQVALCYPLGDGRGAAQARAQAVADHFAPRLDLAEPNLRISITNTPRVAAGFRADDRWVVPVTISYRAFKT